MNRLVPCRRQVVNSLATAAVAASVPMRALAQQSDLPIVGVWSPISPAQFTPNHAAILRGERVSELPVQQPTDFRLVVNLLAFSGLGIAPTTTILARADELIE